MSDRAFSSVPMLKLQDWVRADIKKFVSDKGFACPRSQSRRPQEAPSVTKTTIPRVINDVVQKAHSVYLWVVFAVRDVVRGIDAEDSLEQLEERLKSLPTRLEARDVHMLNEIDK